MPFTPFHLGVGALAKAVAPRQFSFQAFAASQVFMDIEPGIGMLTGAAVLHGPSHTFPGAAVMAAATVGAFALWQRFASKRLFSLGHGIPLPMVAVSAAIGTTTHVALDAMMHADMALATSLGRQLNDATGVGPEVLCVGAAFLASLIAVLRYARQTWRTLRPKK